MCCGITDDLGHLVRLNVGRHVVYEQNLQKSEMTKGQWKAHVFHSHTYWSHRLRGQVSDVQKTPQTDMIISIRLVQKGKRMTTMSGITTRAKQRISVRVVAMYIDSRA